MLTALINSLALIFLALLIGYFIQRIVKSKKNRFFIDLEISRKSLQKIAILFLLPIPFVGIYWDMDFAQRSLLLFPFLCFFQLILGGFIAILISRKLNFNFFDTGAFFCCGFFCNLINVGGLICFLVMGEEGYKLAVFYTLFVPVAYYTIGYPVAKYYALKNKGKIQKLINIKLMLSDPFILIVFGSIVLGFSLNLSGWERPEIFSDIIRIFVPASTVLLLISIGLSMRFKAVKNYLQHSFYILGIKFIIVPVIMVALGLLMGFQRIDFGMPLKVLLILSSTPVAFNSLIPPSIYGLNLDMANSCWVITTFGFGILLPIIFLIINFL